MPNGKPKTDPRSTVVDGTLLPSQPNRDKRRTRVEPYDLLKMGELRGNHQRMCLLHVQGMSNRKVAKTLGLSESYVCQILGSQLAVEYIGRLKAAVETETIQINTKRAEMVGDALSVIDDVMKTSDNDGTRLKAALWAVKAHQESAANQPSVQNQQNNYIVLSRRGDEPSQDNLPQSDGETDDPKEIQAAVTVEES